MISPFGYSGGSHVNSTQLELIPWTLKFSGANCGATNIKLQSQQCHRHLWSVDWHEYMDQRSVWVHAPAISLSACKADPTDNLMEFWHHQKGTVLLDLLTVTGYCLFIRINGTLPLKAFCAVNVSNDFSHAGIWLPGLPYPEYCTVRAWSELTKKLTLKAS